MIVGDPFCFALQFDTVESWNSSDGFWNNGIFSLYINGERVFSTVDVFELRTAFSFYSKAPVEDLCVSDAQVDGATLYRSANDYFCGESTELIQGLFDLTATAMGDNGCFLYFIKTSLGDRLVWSVDGGECVREVQLEPGSVLSVIKKLRSCSL